MSNFGGDPLKGIRAIRQAALAIGANKPVGHGVTNIVIAAGEEMNLAIANQDPK